VDDFKYEYIQHSPFMSTFVPIPVLTIPHSGAQHVLVNVPLGTIHTSCIGDRYTRYLRRYKAAVLQLI
jgi:hypothetical protein